MLRPVQTTAPAKDAFDIAECKAQLRIPTLVTDDDTLLRGYLKRATSFLDGYSGILGRCLINQVWTSYCGSWAVRIKSPFPDVSAAVVKYYDTDDSEVTVDSSLYRVYPEYIMFKEAFTEPEVFDDRDDPISIEWTCGYGADFNSVPDDLRQAAYTLAGHWFENREAVVPNERRVEMDLLPLAFWDLVHKYRTQFAV